MVAPFSFISPIVLGCCEGIICEAPIICPPDSEIDYIPGSREDYSICQEDSWGCASAPDGIYDEPARGCGCYVEDSTCPSLSVPWLRRGSSHARLCQTAGQQSDVNCLRLCFQALGSASIRESGLRPYDAGGRRCCDLEKSRIVFDEEPILRAALRLVDNPKVP